MKKNKESAPWLRTPEPPKTKRAKYRTPEKEENPHIPGKGKSRLCPPDETNPEERSHHPPYHHIPGKGKCPRYEPDDTNPQKKGQHPQNHRVPRQTTDTPTTPQKINHPLSPQPMSPPQSLTVAGHACPNGAESRPRTAPTRLAPLSTSLSTPMSRRGVVASPPRSCGASLPASERGAV